MPRAHLLLITFQDVLLASLPLLLPNCYHQVSAIQCVPESPHQGQGSLPGTLMTLLVPPPFSWGCSNGLFMDLRPPRLNLEVVNFF